jgi:hypothetical protein
MNWSFSSAADCPRLRDLASGLNSDFAVTLRPGILLYLATVAAIRGPNESIFQSCPGTSRITPALFSAGCLLIT